MSEDHIRYDILTQEALRGVVKKVLNEVAQTGLPGEHHFFISFDTRFPGVRISSRMLEQYPEEMTIVLQHQFWDLKVNEAGFEVGLSFSDIPERLIVPYAAVKGFFDPTVQFGLEIDVEREAVDVEDDDDETSAGEAGENITALGAATSVAPKKSAEQSDVKVAQDDVEASDSDDAEDDGDDKSADVVSLDAFRKKT